jgi:chitinase
MPTYDFEDPLVSPSPYSVLGFVVADPRNACNPTWGTYFSMGGADRELDLDRRIVRLRARGGDVIISFGGSANQELSATCTNLKALLNAYRSVVERYGVRTIDFDIEGAALSDAAANLRRANAIRALQLWATRRGRPLLVWLTLPVSPQGLAPEGMSVVSTMLAKRVKLAGVNAMIMDYGASLAAGQSTAAGNAMALHSVFEQLKRAYRQVGRSLTDRQVGGRIGATCMIGRNDVDGEYFHSSDAHAIVALAQRVHLGRVSMRSANQDYQCSANVDTTRISNVCSGVNQKSLAFTWELGELNALLPAEAPVAGTSIASRAPSRDNPATSPYPIWVPTKVYTGGEKVVWHGEVYEAKWWNQGPVPDMPVAHPWDTPWRDLGPVLPSDASTVANGTLDKPSPWSASQVYIAGEKVIDHGAVFEARWWTQGEEPVVRPVRPENASWVLLHTKH